MQNPSSTDPPPAPPPPQPAAVHQPQDFGHTSNNMPYRDTSWTPGTLEDITAEKSQPMPPTGNWFSRNKLKSTLLATGILAILAVAIAVPISAVNRSDQRSLNTQGGGGSSSSNNRNHNDGLSKTDDDGTPIDDNAQANPHVPPLNKDFRYGIDPIRGVNLGGWLVIEPFITPSLFDQFPAQDNVVDEWGLCEKLGPEKAKEQLKKHYETFVTEEDFKNMQKMGINHVRIPTGHWAIAPVQGEPFVPNLSWDYLMKGIRWARKYGLRVMVELHTAPGSQNGWNHSGRKGQVRWLNGTDGEMYGQLTMDTVTKMMEFFFDKPGYEHVVPIFGVLNEPAIYRVDKDRAKQWYHDSHDKIRKITGDGKGPLLTYHDGFLGMPPWNGFFKDPSFQRVILETHTYLIFDDDLVSMPREKQSKFPCVAWERDLNNSMRDNGPTMVGEFSVATNDCGKYLNGVRLGTRYEGNLVDGDTKIDHPVCPGCSCQGVEDWKHWDDDYKKFLLSFVERQMDAFETSYGWFFWTYKTEDHINPHWDYLLGWEQGWIPKDANNRQSSCKDVGPSL
ncbi:glycoside hydrolase superfamily [Phascolomyces articulosus]|uniref:glucan 1,3-beta-glucosidase n=1 Tax=Phascolomyces articulosus TaxID=60185 RepID=A0AAD5K401_9FUNG|nr:glycoside hydrolase superfamily [Phascolomyces articulosus]